MSEQSGSETIHHKNHFSGNEGISLMESGSKPDGREQILKQKIENSLEALKSAPPIGRPRYQEQVLQFVRELFRENHGIETIDGMMSSFVEANIFAGGGWEKEESLIPQLGRGSLLANGIYPVVEALSELRMLAIARGQIKSSTVSSSEAHQFLTELIALNLDFLFEASTEESRQLERQYHFAHRLFSYLVKHIDPSHLFGQFLQELKALAYQRPISTSHIRKILLSGKKMLDSSNDLSYARDFKDYETYYQACFRPTETTEVGDLLDYRNKLRKMNASELEEEAIQFAKLLRETGLSSPFYSVLLKHLSRKHQSIIPAALNLSEHGKAEFEKHTEQILNIMKLSIRPSTHEFILGLAQFLERSLLDRSEVASGIQKVMDLDIRPELQTILTGRKRYGDGISPNGVLTAGLIAVLGQPLGIGQGNNPTCQAARGISLWSQHDPGYLIDLVIAAARDGVVTIAFEGRPLESKKLLTYHPERMEDLKVDPVSQILVPHLDAIYMHMINLVVGRGEDGHKWANPALYGRWIEFGFESVLDFTQTVVKSYEQFVRRFYATHHPEFNDDVPLTYANPVGIFVTSAHGELIGLHAVSIQRIEEAPNGEMRVYFFNPNNEGRQDWGQGIKPSVYEHGEEHGESSLQFEHFASRLYAFHFNPYEEGDAFAVDAKKVDYVVELSRSSWGKAYQWVE